MPGPALSSLLVVHFGRMPADEIAHPRHPVEAAPSPRELDWRRRLPGTVTGGDSFTEVGVLCEMFVATVSE